MIRTSMTLMTILSLAGCLNDGTDGMAQRSTIANPGVTFFDAAQRMEVLRRRTCSPYSPPQLTQYTPNSVDGTGGWNNYDRSGREFAEALNGVAMLYLDTQQPRYADAAIENLLRFAEVDAFWLRGNTNASAYAVAQVRQFLLPAWQVLLEYDGLTAEDRSTIERWLVRLVERATREQPDTNNHQTSQGMTLILAGTLFDRPRWFRRGMKIGYRDQIDQLRADGSWPWNQNGDNGRWSIPAATLRTC